MNLLFISDVPADFPTSGSEQVLYHQIAGMAARGHRVRAVSRISGRDPRIRIRRAMGSTLAQYDADISSFLHFFRDTAVRPPKAFRAVTGAVRPDVVIAHQPFTLCSLLLRKQLAGLPILYVFHSPGHEEFRISGKGNNHFLDGLEIRLRKSLERKCLLRSSRVMTLSRFMKEQLFDIHGIRKSKVFINPGGVDPDRFKPFPDRDSYKRKFGMPDHSIHLLTVRNLDPRMGIDNLLKAMRILNREKPFYHLVIGGEGPEREKLEDLSNRLGIRRAVKFTGFVPPGDLAALYCAADFFILPTRQLEGFGLVTPESMACGTPVLGTPVGGTKEILSKFETSFLFENTAPESIAAGIQNARSRFFSDEARYAALREKCTAHAVTHYSWDRHIDQLSATLDSIGERSRENRCRE
jgi:glycosyltransferase involved in cell wall biosynthesis